MYVSCTGLGKLARIGRIGQITDCSPLDVQCVRERTIQSLTELVRQAYERDMATYRLVLANFERNVRDNPRLGLTEADRPLPPDPARYVVIENFESGVRQPWEQPAPIVTASGTPPRYLANSSPPAIPPPAGGSAPASGTATVRLNFRNLSGGDSNRLRVGDQWELTITGAPPNRNVAVVGGKNGQRNRTVMGQTDAAGQFSLRGTIDSESIGTWWEQWQVNDQVIGEFSFVVEARGTAPSSGTPAPAGGTTPPAPTTITAPLPSPGVVATPGGLVVPETIAGLPAWALGAGAVLLVLALRR